MIRAGAQTAVCATGAVTSLRHGALLYLAWIPRGSLPPAFYDGGMKEVTRIVSKVALMLDAALLATYLWFWAYDGERVATSGFVYVLAVAVCFGTMRLISRRLP